MGTVIVDAVQPGRPSESKVQVGTAGTQVKKPNADGDVPRSDDTDAEVEFPGTNDHRDWEDAAPPGARRDPTPLSLQVDELKQLICDEFARLHEKIDQTNHPHEAQGPDAQQPIKAISDGKLSLQPTAPSVDEPQSPNYVLLRPVGTEHEDFENTSTPVQANIGIRGQTVANRELLFDLQGRPTWRLQYMLTGLANHLIKNIEPLNSGVLTPRKLASFYMTYGVDREVYPFADLLITETRETHDSISNLFADLDCEHYLVQRTRKVRPTVPGLTVDGFVQWMTLNMRACPDTESKRLANLLQALPFLGLDNEGRAHRDLMHFSRELLPATVDSKARRLLDEAVDDFLEEIHHMQAQQLPTRSASTRQPAPKPVPQLQRATSVKTPPYLPPPPVGQLQSAAASYRRDPGAKSHALNQQAVQTIPRYGRSLSDAGTVPPSKPPPQSVRFGSASAASGNGPLAPTSELVEPMNYTSRPSPGDEYSIGSVTKYSPRSSQRADIYRLAQGGNLVGAKELTKTASTPMLSPEPSLAPGRRAYGAASAAAGPSWDEYLGRTRSSHSPQEQGV